MATISRSAAAVQQPTLKHPKNENELLIIHTDVDSEPLCTVQAKMGMLKKIKKKVGKKKAKKEQAKLDNDANGTVDTPDSIEREEPVPPVAEVATAEDVPADAEEKKTEESPSDEEAGVNGDEAAAPEVKTTPTEESAASPEMQEPEKKDDVEEKYEESPSPRDVSMSAEEYEAEQEAKAVTSAYACCGINIPGLTA